MTELEKIRKDTAEKLLGYGYEQDYVNDLVNSFVKVTQRGVDNEPVRVLTATGHEVWLE